MSTDQFFLGLHRFIARRGAPRQIISDNAKQFKLARKVLNKAHQEAILNDKLRWLRTVHVWLHYENLKTFLLLSCFQLLSLISSLNIYLPSQTNWSALFYEKLELCFFASFKNTEHVAAASILYFLSNDTFLILYN